MFPIAEFIVAMWLFPVTFFVIIPLVMLIGKTLIKLVFNSKSKNVVER